MDEMTDLVTWRYGKPRKLVGIKNFYENFGNKFLEILLPRML